MAAKPSIPKGTRDFSPVEMAKRNYIFNTIRDVYHLYGFQQIETPAMEMLSTLMGKYGDEGDKLLFKIQNSGDYFSGITDEELLSRNAAKLASKFCEKGLRYDLTVPFARYVVMHRDEITFPFKRYQIQPVWRADRPQKGPSFCSSTLNMLKNTSLVFLMTVQDITARAKIAAGQQYKYVEGYLDILITYIIVCTILELLFKLWEKRTTRYKTESQKVTAKEGGVTA